MDPHFQRLQSQLATGMPVSTTTFSLPEVRALVRVVCVFCQSPCVLMSKVSRCISSRVFVICVQS
jgi:hypothetical protein